MPRYHYSWKETQPHPLPIVSLQNTPDKHFILDRHPKYDNVIIGAGFSGESGKGEVGCPKAESQCSLPGRMVLTGH